MKIIYTIFVLFLAPVMCTNNTNIPKYFQSENVVWKDSDKVYILVRHAEKQTGDDPELTSEGVIRAKKLALILEGIQEMDIYSSDYNRTKATIAPLCEKMDEDRIIYDARKLDEFSKELGTKEAGINIIAGHSNTTPSFTNAILGEERFAQIDDSNNGNLYIVTITGDEKSAQVLHIN